MLPDAIVWDSIKDILSRMNKQTGMKEHPQAVEKDLEIGIEIEVEGKNVLHDGILSYWNIDKDGSLRNDSAEYKLKKPVPRGKVLAVLEYLYRKLDEHHTEIHDSQRTGVHVHVNVQNLTVLKLMNFLTLYVCIEELMVRHAGEHRVGNLFCLRASDAEGYVAAIVEAVKGESMFRDLMQDNLRYASVNVKALAEFGSLEFRALRGGKVTPQEIATWAKMLLEIRDAAVQYDSPTHIIEAFSKQGAREFVRGIGPTVAHHLMLPNLAGLVMEGVRQAQELAYAIRWDQKRKEPVPEVEMYAGKMIDPDNQPEWLRQVVAAEQQLQQFQEGWVRAREMGEPVVRVAPRARRPANNDPDW